MPKPQAIPCTVCGQRPPHGWERPSFMDEITRCILCLLPWDGRPAPEKATLTLGGPTTVYNPDPDHIVVKPK